MHLGGFLHFSQKVVGVTLSYEGELILDMGLVQKLLSAICLDSQGMVGIVFFKWCQSCHCYSIPDGLIMHQGG